MRHLQHRDPHGRQHGKILNEKSERRTVKIERANEREMRADTIKHSRRAQWIIIVTIIIENVHKMHYKTIATGYTIHDVYLVIAIERRGIHVCAAIYYMYGNDPIGLQMHTAHFVCFFLCTAAVAAAVVTKKFDPPL